MAEHEMLSAKREVPPQADGNRDQRRDSDSEKNCAHAITMARLIAVRYVVDHRPMFDRRVFCCAANGFMCRRGLTCAVLTVLAFAVHAQEQSAFQWSGFALLRQSTSETQRPLEQQRQIGRASCRERGEI